MTVLEELVDRERPTSGEPEPIPAPFTGEPLANIPQWTAEDVRSAFDQARGAQERWAHRPVAERVAVLRTFLRMLRAEQKDLFDVLQQEGGKARIDAAFELGEAYLGGAYHLRTAAGLLAPTRHGGALPGLTTTIELRHPKGVVVVIAPWNFPVALGLIDALPALLAGNAVLLKPDNQTALSTMFTERIAHRAGLPADLFAVVTGRPAEIGDALIDGADYVAFTGSTATGRTIAAKAGARLIGCSLELGGKNPMIVLADADLRRAAAAVTRTSFANAGQLCMTAERLYVHSSVYPRFLELVRQRAHDVRLGAALDFSADMGSLTTSTAVERVHGFVEQAQSAGATVVTGGSPSPGVGPWFYQPTVLTGVPENARLHRAEVFGPVLAVYPFDDVEQAVELANDTDYGLTASVWTRDVAAGQQIAARVRAGGVGVNDGYTAAFASYGAPMGGRKASGLGSRHGVAGLLRYTEPQSVATQRLASMDSRFGLPRNLHGRVLTAGLGLLGRLPRRW